VTKKVYAPCLILLLSAVCLTSFASAQTTWWKTYGGPDADMGYSARQTTDDGYIVTGWTQSFHAGVILIKTDSRGETLWVRTYGGLWPAEGYSVRQTTDGGYIVAGRCTDVVGMDVFDYACLVKTTAQGDTLWTRTYGGLSPADGSAGYSVQQTADSGYIIAGGIDNDAYLVKTDSHGDTLWTKTYGGTERDVGYSVQQTADGGYVVAGQTGSFGAGGYDAYLIKTNASGDTLWTRTYGGTGDDCINSTQQTTDGGYIATGYTMSFGEGGAAYLIKTDAQGDTQWTRTYGCPSTGSSVQQTADGGYVIAGGQGNDGCLIKTDARGHTLWTRTYGWTEDIEAKSVQQTADGGYVIAGSLGYPTGDIDVCLIKTDANGSVREPVLQLSANLSTQLQTQPNPFTSVARVPGHENEFFALSDVTGRRVAICKGDRIGEGLRPGVYFLSPVDTKVGKAVTIIKAAH